MTTVMDCKSDQGRCHKIVAFLRSVRMVAFLPLICGSTLVLGDEPGVGVAITIPVQNTIGSRAYLDLDPESSSTLWASIKVARESKEGWRADDGYMYQPVGDCLIVELPAQGQDSAMLSGDCLLIFKDKSWKRYSDPTVAKLCLAFHNATKAPLGSKYRAVEKAEAIRATLKAEGINAVVRKEERKVGKAAAMIAFRLEGEGEVIVDLTQETAEDLYKEFRDAKNLEDGWVANEKLVHASTRSEVLLAYDGIIHSFSFAPEGLNMGDDRRYRTITTLIAKQLAACQARVARSVSHDIDSATLAQKFSQELNAQGMKAEVRQRK